MELGHALVIALAATLVLAALVLYFGLRLKRKKQLSTRKAIAYNDARKLARKLLKERYQGKRGFVKPYAEEFDFKNSSETLRKVLQETNPVLNKYYLQTVLDDLKPNKYQVQAPDLPNASRAEAVA